MHSKTQTNSWIVYLATFPPRECGIATFTRDLVEASDKLFMPVEESRVVAMQEDGAPQNRIYTDKVIRTIQHSTAQEYVSAAEYLNSLEQVKLVSIQHEFGIFGGSYGNLLFGFLEKITKPVSITFHTVLPGPNNELRETVIHLATKVQRIVVMTKLSKSILVEQYGIDESKIVIIPHGIHPAPYSNGMEEKKTLKLSRNIVLSTFGLLNGGKGIEYALDALPAVVKKYKEVRYLIIGETHPTVKRQEGEKYREFLQEKIKKLHLSKYVKFYDRYLSTEELLDFLNATDIYLSLSTNPNQAVSGTLSYALGAGRAVISTAFAQAKEDVTPEVGTTVGFNDAKAIEKALLIFLDQKIEIKNKGKNAYFRTRRMTWQNVALAYMKNYASLVTDIARAEQALPPINLSHIVHMTDRFGMIQFAKLSEPDISTGYTLDDNARALMAMSLYHKKFNDSLSAKLASKYLKVLEYMLIPESHGFHNYVNHDGSFAVERNTQENLEDANARCFEALAFASSSQLPVSVKRRALRVIKKSFQLKIDLGSPRAAAHYIKGFYRLINEKDSGLYKERLVHYADFLLQRFADAKSDEWFWFEDILSYSNGTLPEGLLLAYKITGKQEYYDVAKLTLDFLIKHSFEGSICVPIGQSGWFKKSGKRHFHDQQPEEVTDLVTALKLMYEISGDDFYEEKAYQAFTWYLGNNLLGQIVYDQATGGCYDGVGEKEINLNQGAESTVVYLLARLAINEKN